MLVKDYIKKHGNTHFQSVLTKKGKQKLSYPNWIITDMRFPNEMEAVVAKGGITIRVVRPDMNSLQAMVPAHASETALDDHTMHYDIINDGTIEDLIEKVREILIERNII